MVREHGKNETLSVQHFGAVVRQEPRHTSEGLPSRDGNSQVQLGADELRTPVVPKRENPGHGIFEIVEVNVGAAARPNASSNRKEGTPKVNVLPLIEVVAKMSTVGLDVFVRTECVATDTVSRHVKCDRYPSCIRTAVG